MANCETAAANSCPSACAAATAVMQLQLLLLIAGIVVKGGMGASGISCGATLVVGVGVASYTLSFCHVGSSGQRRMVEAA
jgi:hypothetical protein